MRKAFHRELAHQSDRLVNLILHSDLQWIDIEIEIDKMRQSVEEEMPARIDLFEEIYPSRFRRIWKQWKQE